MPRILWRQGMAPVVEQFFWQQFFSDPTLWWDNTRSKESKVTRGLDNRHEHAWADLQLATWDVGITKTTPETVSTSGESGSAAHEDHLEVGLCRRLCEGGRAIDAVNALNLLIQRGCHIPNDLFYRVLKYCTANKDLILGRRVHALTVESGYEGDAFLATHLIGLYASHGNLEEAMRVFTKVSRPSAYNWATIIFACTKNGEAAQAIRLYRQMRESNAKADNRIFVAVLKACATVKDLVAGMEVHDHILASLGKPDIFVQTGLLDMYVKCGSIEEARILFDKLPERDVVTWTAMLAGYAQNGMGQEALSLFSAMQQEGLSPPSSVTFVCLLQACASIGVGALHEGKKLHEQIESRGLQDDVVIGGSLVNMYAKCGSLEIARTLFDRLSEKNMVTWNVMLTGYAQQAMGQEALGLYSSMEQEGVFSPDPITFVCLLQACASIGVQVLHEGRKLHAQIEEVGLQDDVVVGGSLVNMYAKCGSLEDARNVFNRLPDRNMVTWNAMIAGYAQQGKGQEALTLYDSMQEKGLCFPDSITYVSLLQSCARVGVEALHHGKQLHAQIKEQGLHDDLVVACSLFNMYAKCGSLMDARSMFDRLPHKDLITWTVMIAAYAQQGMGEEALTLYSNMQQQGLSPPDSVTFVCLLQACAIEGLSALRKGKHLHAQIEEQGLEIDVVVGGSLVNMYAKCGSVEGAHRLFDRLVEKNTVTWNALLTGYAQHGKGQEALSLYGSMQEQGLCSPDSVTYVSLLQSCAKVGVEALDEGKKLHAQIQKRGMQDDVTLGGSLVNMYAKCGSFEDARSVFDRLPDKTIATWNAILAGYAQQGMAQEAFCLYESMQKDDLCPPDSVTFVCLLQACAIGAGLLLGKQLHAQIEEQGMLADVVVGGALVNFYAKCGSMFDSQQVFDSLPRRSVEAWAALIGGYTRHGDSQVVFDLLGRMKVEGIQPNDNILLSVLTVCSHAGAVDEGRTYFEAMETNYGISPTLEHYTCMMDLLGRAGHLDEALQMAKTMPFPPDEVVWVTLLGACQKWNNVEIGQQAFEFAVGQDGKGAAPYVLMSNIYARAQMWEEAKEIEARRLKCGAWKDPGQSWWTDINGVAHTFAAGESEGGYAKKLE